MRHGRAGRTNGGNPDAGGQRQNPANAAAQAAVWQRPVKCWTDADVLPFEVARCAEVAARKDAERWKGNSWLALMLAADRRGNEPDE